jgi:hypothetical protein
MADNIGQRVAAYRPSKAVWFWTTLGAVILTMIVGFSWGGWVTGDAATKRAESSAQAAVTDFAAGICAYRFLHADGAAVQLSALKEQQSYERSSTLEDNGWVTFAGAEKPLKGVGRECADRLMEADVPAAATPVAEASPATVSPS